MSSTIQIRVDDELKMKSDQPVSYTHLNNAEKMISLQFQHGGVYRYPYLFEPNDNGIPVSYTHLYCT